jgi:ribosomal protein S18 acetylase RimI-like enzyme
MVAEVGGEFAGMAWAHVEETAPETVHLFQMWVAPAYRSRGVGRKLLDRAIEWAKSCGAEQIVLGVTSGDSPARRLYASCGFKAVGNLEPLRPMSELMMQNMSLSVSSDAA